MPTDIVIRVMEFAVIAIKYNIVCIRTCKQVYKLPQTSTVNSMLNVDGLYSCCWRIIKKSICWGFADGRPTTETCYGVVIGFQDLFYKVKCVI